MTLREDKAVGGSCSASHSSAPRVYLLLLQLEFHPRAMASVQLCGAAVGAASPVQALRVPTAAAVGVRPARRAFGGLVVRAATVVATKVRFPVQCTMTSLIIVHEGWFSSAVACI